MTVAECVNLLLGKDPVTILTHRNPDGDTLGSACALCSALRRLGKRAALFPNPEIAPHFMEFVSPYLGTDGTGQGAYVVSVDVAGEEMFPRGFSGKVGLCIDHHPGFHDFAAESLVDSGKASCGEIVLRVVQGFGSGLTPEEAGLLYMAVATDCGCFCYGNTKADTLRDAAYLMDCGADYHRLNRLLFRSFSLARLKLEGMIFSGLRSYRDNQINLALVTLEMMAQCGATEDDCDDLANLAGRVRGNRVAITVREVSEGKSKGSVRTDGSLDAAEICARYGGGGHRMAAGCTVADTPEALAEGLLAAVNARWP